jgi:hypothetical protein
MPPAWYRAGYFGTMTRLRFQLNCWMGLVAFPALALLTYTALVVRT